MSLALERVFKLDRTKKDYNLFSGVTLNYIMFNGCVNLMQRLKKPVSGEKQNRDVCKCLFQPLWAYFMSNIIGCHLPLINVSIGELRVSYSCL